MPNTEFRFKQFLVKQEKCAFKVGTDAVLIGAWAKADKASQILDIGSGTGIIALMMAQKSQAKITAIDIDESAVEQCKENVASSPWKNRIDVFQTSLQDFAENCHAKFDLIITNPPYFTDSSKNNDYQLTIARHNDWLQFEDLVNGAKKLLTADGKLYVVLPTQEAVKFRTIANNAGLILSQLLRVQTKPGLAYEKRHVMLFKSNPTEFSESTVIIEENNRHQYSEDYKMLTKDFYLNF